jgi:hypothetical protein
MNLKTSDIYKLDNSTKNELRKSEFTILFPACCKVTEMMVLGPVKGGMNVKSQSLQQYSSSSHMNI